MRTFALTLLEILVLTALAAGLALAVNALRPGPLPLVQDWRATILARYTEGESVTVDQARELWDMQGALFVDARDPETFATGHVPGAVNVPYDPFARDMEQRMAELPADRLLVVYCSDIACSLGPELADALRYSGFDAVLVMPEGWAGWSEAQHPAEQGQGGAS